MAQMASNSPVKPEFAFESDAAASFLVAKCGSELQEYQVSMLEHNNIGCVIPLNVVRKEGVNCFYYNITSKISLNFFLKRKKFNREEFLKFLINVMSAINESAGYLLADSNFVFDGEYVYIDPETLEPALVYIPTRLEDGWGAALRGFVSDLLMQHINAEEFDGENLVQRILAATNSRVFNVRSFLNLLNELLYGRRRVETDHGNENEEEAIENIPFMKVSNSGAQDGKMFSGRAGREQSRAPEARGIPGAGKAAGGVPRARERPEAGKAASRAAPQAHRASESSKTVSREALREHRASVKNRAPEAGGARGTGANPQTSRIRLMVLSAVLIQVLIGAAIYLCRGFLDNVSENPAVTYTAVVMIVIAVELLIFKKIKDSGLIVFEECAKSDAHLETIGAEEEIKRGGYEATACCDACTDAEYEAGTAYRASCGVACGTVPGIASGPPPRPAALTSSTASCEAAAAIPPPGGSAYSAAAACSNRTELLSSPMLYNVPVFKSRGKQRKEDDIYIDKDDFIIGRLEGYADHILKNNAVGKLHVQVFQRDGACFIKDLNSLNGTFINDVRVDSNKEIELEEKDIIRIANCEYEFLRGQG